MSGQKSSWVGLNCALVSDVIFSGQIVQTNTNPENPSPSRLFFVFQRHFYFLLSSVSKNSLTFSLLKGEKLKT